MTIKAVLKDPMTEAWILVEGWLMSANVEEDREEAELASYGRERLLNSVNTPVINFDLQFRSKGYTVVTDEWVAKRYPTQYREELERRKELE